MQLDEKRCCRLSSSSPFPYLLTRTHVAEAVDVQYVRERDGDEEVLYEAVEQTDVAFTESSVWSHGGKGRATYCQGSM